MGGALAGDSFRDVLYENPGFSNHRLELELVGVESNRAAIGARIRVDIRENGRRRSIYKVVNSGGSFGANSIRRQTVGLGKADRIESLSIDWPGSGTKQVLTDVAVDSSVLVKEGADPLRSRRAR